MMRHLSATALLALILAATALTACGRKDVPDYPPDAIERPGALQRGGNNNNIRYY